MVRFRKFLDLYDKERILFVQSLNEHSRCQYIKTPSNIDLSWCVGRENLFFSPNSFGYRYDYKKKYSYISRDGKHLQTLECLYVDLDLKDSDHYMEHPETVYEYLKIHYFGEGTELPTPTMAINSGNGLHLYWKINSLCYKGNLDQYKMVQQYIFDMLCDFGADSAVTNDFVRILRIPGTKNIKRFTNHVTNELVRSEKKCEMLDYTGIVYDLHAITLQYAAVYTREKRQRQYQEIENRKREKRKIRKLITPLNDELKVYARAGEEYIPFLDQNPELLQEKNMTPFLKYKNILYKKRIHDLKVLLIQFRDVGPNVEVKKRKRENIFFLLRYYFLESGYTDEDALAEMERINDLLKDPLSENELNKNTKSAYTYYTGSKLNWKNSDIIKFLNMSANEISHMTSIMDADERKKRVNKRNYDYYRSQLRNARKNTKEEDIIKRKEAVYQLRKAGKSVKEICNKLGYNKSTIYVDIKEVTTKDYVPVIKETKTIIDISNNETKETSNIAEEEFKSAVNTVEFPFLSYFPKNSVPIINYKSM